MPKRFYWPAWSAPESISKNCLFPASWQRWAVLLLPVLRHFWTREKQVSSPFMEDFDCFSSEHQLVLVSLSGNQERTQAAEALLEILLGYSDREIVKEALCALGRIRRESAAKCSPPFSAPRRRLIPQPGGAKSEKTFFFGGLSRSRSRPGVRGLFHRAAVSSIGGERFSFALVFPLERARGARRSPPANP